jgi:signal recognition particle subunit SRP54
MERVPASVPTTLIAIGRAGIFAVIFLILSGDDMLDTITNGFREARLKLQGKQTITEETIADALVDIRTSLLEADVDLGVVKKFVARVKEKALGEVVTLKVKTKSGAMKVTPYDHFVKICQDELEALMGPVDTGIYMASKGPTGIMMVGLQGSGKTTTCAKLAKYLIEEEGKKPLLVAADIYRPAAIDQLKVLGERIGVPVFSVANLRPAQLCQAAYHEARTTGRDVVIMDTAGRLAVDDRLMTELEDIKRLTEPENIFFVCDAMIGQDAVRTAAEFNRRLKISGFVLTKLDGDARGGAALSIKEVTGTPIKFLGMGEGLGELEEFRPQGLASRILGMGDVVGLMQDFGKVVDEERAEQDAMKMLKGNFNFDDFLEQLGMIQRMGSLQGLFEKMPFMSDMLPAGFSVDDKELVRVEAMINSMTHSERLNPDVISESRIKRIARGSGHSLKDVRDLLERFMMARQMMGDLGRSTGLLGRLGGLGKMAKKAAKSKIPKGMMPGKAGLPGVGAGAGGPMMMGMPDFSPGGLPAGGGKATRKAGKTSEQKRREKNKRKKKAKMKRKQRKK